MYTKLQPKTEYAHLYSKLRLFREGGAIAVCDSRIITANHQAESIFGYERGELAGEPLSVLIPRKLIGDHDRGLEDFLYSTTNNDLGRSFLAFEGIKKTGEIIILNILFGKIYRGKKPIGLAFFFEVPEEISRQKLIQQELLLTGMARTIEESLNSHRWKEKAKRATGNFWKAIVAIAFYLFFDIFISSIPGIMSGKLVDKMSNGQQREEIRRN